MAARVEISKRLLAVNSASSLITRMLSVSVFVWLQQYLLRRITAEEYSLLPVLYSVMMFAPLVTTILSAGLGRYIVEAYAKDDDDRVIQIVSTMFPILCGAGLVFLCCGWTFAWYIDKILNIDPHRLWDARIMMALLMLSAAIRLPLAPFTTGLFIRQKFVLQNVIGVGTEIVRLTLLFALLLGVSTRVLWVVTASVCAEMLSLAITLKVSRRLLPLLRFSASHIYWPIAKELTAFGGWNFVSQLADTIRSSADPIILNVLATPMDVTCFYLGSFPFRQLQEASVTARAPVAPAIMGLYARADYTRLRSAYLRIGRYSLWTILAAAVPGIVLAREIVSLYVPNEYVGAATVMALMLAIFPTSYGNCLVSQIAQAANAVRDLALRFIVMHAANLVLTVYLIAVWHLGAVGSALATLVVGVVFQPLLMWPLGWKLTRTKPGEWIRQVLVPGCVPSLAALAFLIPCKSLFSLSSWTLLLGAGVCWIVIYGIVLIAFCLQPCDKADLVTVIGNSTRLLVSMKAKCAFLNPYWNRP